MIYFQNLVLGNRNRRTKNLTETTPFFIIGSGRNGSTLLARLLNEHPQIFLPPEQFAMPHIIFRWHFFRFWPWGKFCKKALELFSKNNQNWNMTKEEKQKTLDELNSLQPLYRNAANAINTIFTTFGKLRQQKFSLWGDHTSLSTSFVPLILKEFPEAKFIFLVRDPRDVVLSYSKIEGHPAQEPIKSAKKWKNSIQTYKWLKEKHPEKVMYLRYEDLVTNTEIQLKEICSFIGMSQADLFPTPNEHEKVRDRLGTEGKAHHENVYLSVSANAIEKWKTELEPKTLEKVEKITRKAAESFGYK